jgi:hypothetical protein
VLIAGTMSTWSPNTRTISCGGGHRGAITPYLVGDQVA